MIETFYCGANPAHDEKILERRSALPDVRVGITDDFKAVRAVGERNRALEAGHPDIFVALWILNDKTQALCQLMADILASGKLDFSDVQNEWLTCIEAVRLPSEFYDVAVDFQSSRSDRLPFGYLSHSDGAVPGLTLSPQPTQLYEGAMTAGPPTPLIHSPIKHPKRIQPPPFGAMLAMTPWREEGVIHSAAFIHDRSRLVNRVSFRPAA